MLGLLFLSLNQRYWLKTPRLLGHKYMFFLKKTSCFLTFFSGCGKIIQKTTTTGRQRDDNGTGTGRVFTTTGRQRDGNGTETERDLGE